MSVRLVETLDGQNTEVTFLVVDDDRISVMAVKRALKKMNISNPVIEASNGCDALDILQAAYSGDQLSKAFLITLDLNMPRMNGFEFLEALSKEPNLNRTVVFVLSTSDAPNDIAAASACRVAGYIVKDDLNDSLARALNTLEQFQCVPVTD